LVENSGLSIALFGPYPPPYGGVSLHIKRLNEYLGADGISARVYCNLPEKPVDQTRVVAFREPVGGKRWMLQRFGGIRENIIHSHLGWFFSPALLLFRMKQKPVIVTIHDQMVAEKWRKAGPSARISARFLMRDPGVHWITVSAAVRARLVPLGAAPQNIRNIPAYLPSIEKTGCELPQELDQFLREHTPVLTIYGWRVFFLANGEDAYGFDLAFAALKMVKAQYPRIGLVCVVPIADEGESEAYLKVLIDQSNLAGHVYVQGEPLPEMDPLWRRSDIVLRPSRTDGDSLAVREALALNIPVIASDASPRPIGVIAHRQGDAASLSAAIESVLKGAAVQRPESISSVDYYQEIKNLYFQAAHGSG
jgi:glycosyltransferase involved in cell wall biosynthesis